AMHSFGFLLVPAAGGQDLVVMLVVQGLHALADASGEVDRGFALLGDHRLAEHYAYRGPAGCGPAASLGHGLVAADDRGRDRRHAHADRQGPATGFESFIRPSVWRPPSGNTRIGTPERSRRREVPECLREPSRSTGKALNSERTSQRRGRWVNQ